MCELGNHVINQIYEARVEEMNMKRPHPSSSRLEKEAWIRAKYVEKKFITKFPKAGLRPMPGSEVRTPEKPPKPFLKPKPPHQARGNAGGPGAPRSFPHGAYRTGPDFQSPGTSRMRAEQIFGSLEPPASAVLGGRRLLLGSHPGEALLGGSPTASGWGVLERSCGTGGTFCLILQFLGP
ncbi:Arf-GAP with coiled-coil, ANK repeat and PH domain-containing protein 1 [Varanus komodoensis]|nr:Arf-GAP with coiled-coil, ANK repeat and PH domain-containing protein 1 [Varanus komodoensis]